jgi:hypothetical protein
MLNIIIEYLSEDDEVPSSPALKHQEHRA